ncbi:hypothetical protein C9374_009042 [Naegleria lovaniensis]|uniref:Major facilitator superfamily (MFS) profile domain-containing protein n=1 Tax=Naegleria lovaniensis TaxID=51637 RepID=A0AA88GJA8_NAELO|nr:uncharacterized protein C9374_009042 [Naegleria lovaniensis]KAG2377526.1 hypothetical protein C9374_009042 [Naegleria lovaniensis]
MNSAIAASDDHHSHTSIPPNHNPSRDSEYDTIPLEIHPVAAEFRKPLASPVPPSPLQKAFSQTSLNLKFSLNEWKTQRKEQLKTNLRKDTWKRRGRALLNLLKSRKFWESVLICYGFIPLGLGLAMLGPTLPSLKQKLKKSEGTMGLLFTLRGVGYILSSLIGGWVLDYLKSKVQSGTVKTILNQIILLIGLILVSGAFAAIPFLTSFTFVVLTYFVVGLGLGCVDLTSNVLIIWIWGNHRLVSTFLQFLHACFGIGAFICPIIVKIVFDSYPSAQPEGGAEHPINNPLALSHFIGAAVTLSGVIPIAIFCYLALKHPPQQPVDQETANNQVVEEVAKSFDEERVSNIGDVFHDIELEESPKMNDQNISNDATHHQAQASPLTSFEDEDEEEEEAKEQLTKPTLWQKIVVCALTGFALLNYVGAEIGFGSLVVSYIVKSNIATPSEAFLLNSGFWLSFTITRFAGVLLSAVFTDTTLLIVDIVACFLGIIPLLIFPYSMACLWVCAIILGFGFASMYPITISLPSSTMKFEVSGFMTSIMVFGGCVGELVVPVGMTLSFEYIGPTSIFYFIFIVCVIASICYVALLLLFRPKKAKTNPADDEVIDAGDNNTSSPSSVH